MKKWAWAMFAFVGLIWGSSFMLIRISVEDPRMSPLQLVFIRAGIAAVGLLAFVLLRGIKIPTERHILVPILIIGVGNTAIPFFLISRGETVIESSVASVLQSTASLFTFILAHYFSLSDERLSPQKIGGITLGFTGVFVLFANKLTGVQSFGSLAGIGGMLLVVLASLFYAVFSIYSRRVIRNHGVPPLVMSAVSMVSATAFIGIFLFASPLWGGQGFV